MTVDLTITPDLSMWLNALSALALVGAIGCSARPALLPVANSGISADQLTTVGSPANRLINSGGGAEWTWAGAQC